MKHLPNWLILVGTNRDAGKTTLACNIIEKFSANKVVAVKISPHFHALAEGEKVLQQHDDFIIIEETRINTGKDSSRMLRAGAAKVFYIQVWDNQLDRAMEAFLKIIGSRVTVICESGWIRNLIHPGVFLILSRAGAEDNKKSIRNLKDFDHRWVHSDGEDFDFDTDQLRLVNGSWEIA